MHNKIGEILGNGKNFWKELRNLELIPKVTDALHGFMPDELNDYFSSIAISTAPSDGFSFLPVSEADVILAVSHFKTEAKEKDGIPQGIVSKVLRVIAPFLTI